jgi:hypothetical protein
MLMENLHCRIWQNNEAVPPALDEQHWSIALRALRMCKTLSGQALPLRVDISIFGHQQVEPPRQ